MVDCQLMSTVDIIFMLIQQCLPTGTAPLFSENKDIISYPTVKSMSYLGKFISNWCALTLYIITPHVLFTT